MQLAEVMNGARLKVQRASSHIRNLEADAANLPSELYEISLFESRSKILLLHPDIFDLKYVPKADVSLHFAAIIGDAFNNLREALDYWMNAAMQTVGPKRMVHFPFSAEHDKLKEGKTFKDIEKWFPEAASFIDQQVKPSRDTNESLWAVTDFSNLNKHNEFVPTAALAMITNINAVTGGNQFTDCGVGGSANEQIGMMRSDVPIQFSPDYKASVNLTFAVGTVFDGKEVIKQIGDVFSTVSSTLDTLEAFIKPYCA